MTSLYLAALIGFLAAQLPVGTAMSTPRTRDPGGGRSGRRWRRLASASLATALAFVVVYLVRWEVGGYVAPACTALALATGQRVPLIQWLRTGRVGPLRAPTLAGIFLAMFWPLGVTWIAASLLLRLWAERRRRRLRWIPPLQAGLAIAGGYLWQLPDAFLILAFLLGAQLVAQALQHFMPAGWLARQRQGRNGRQRPALPLLGRSGVIGITLLGITIYFLNLYVYHGYGNGRSLIRRAEVDVRAVALTFDDGPNPRFTPEMLDILARYDVRATFFLVGQAVEEYPGLARRIVAEGHEIGNHTYSHHNLLGARRETIRREIQAGNRAIAEVTGIHPRYFRPPRGAYNSAAIALAHEEGQRVILYSLSSRDWLELAPRDIARNVLRRVRPGDILLLHDGGDLIRSRLGDRSNTLRALPLIIEGLQEQGYALLTVHQLLLLWRLEQEGSADDGMRPTAGAVRPAPAPLAHGTPRAGD